MGALLSRLIENAMAPVRQAIASVIRSAILGLVALALLSICLGFFTAAGFLYLLSVFTPVIAALIAGGVFFVLAIIILIILMAGGSGGGTAAPRREPVRRAVRDPEDDVAGNLAEALSQGRAGGERLALLAGAQIGRQLRPFHLLALAFIGGLIAGRRIDTSR